MLGDFCHAAGVLDGAGAAKFVDGGLAGRW